MPARRLRFSRMSFRFSYGRPPAVAANAMVATSQPLATRAGLRMLERGGNAADAAIAAAAVLSVVEPMSTGLGGDCFALVWRDGQLEALDSAGPAPADAEQVEPVAQSGPLSVDVPGAVGGWAELARRHCRFGLDTLLADAIDVAEQGFAVGAITARAWSAVEPPTAFAPAPSLGERFRLPELGATLREIAADGPAAFYGGRIGRAIVSASWLEEDDLSSFRPRWVEPLRLTYRGCEVVELPPPTQGVAALEALGLLEGLEPDLPARIACVQLALEDAFARVRDGAEVGDLLDAQHLTRRRSERAATATELPGGTVYLCAVDGDRMAVSFIQSLFGPFGSGVVAPGTGVALNNRGACFEINGRVEPGRRPYHTIIPGMLFRDGELLGPFGVMGGLIQAQAHVQLVSALVDEGLDPQAALDRPRFRVDGTAIHLEEGLWPQASLLEQLGHTVVLDRDAEIFGGGQAILVERAALVGGSDPRKDGYAAGF